MLPIPDPVLIDVLHCEGGVLPQLLVLLLGLAPGQDAVHWHRHQLESNLVIWRRVILRDQTDFSDTVLKMKTASLTYNSSFTKLFCAVKFPSCHTHRIQCIKHCLSSSGHPRPLDGVAHPSSAYPIQGTWEVGAFPSPIFYRAIT